MSSEKNNRMVWDRNKRGHYEVWYSTFNHRATATGFWIRYTLESPLGDHGEPYCQLWFAFFDARHPERNFGINRKFPVTELAVSEDPFSLEIAGAFMRHGELKGQLSGDTHEVTWDLAFKPTLFTHRHLPDAVYSGKWADSRVLSPNLMIYINGEVTVDGEIYELDGEPGCQSHVWGRKHAHAHAWSHCNAFREDPTACLESTTVRLKRAGLVTPPMTFVSLYLGSEVYHFNRFATLPLTRGSWETGLYELKATGRRMKLQGELRCRPEDLITTPYVDPDGEPSFCHNTEVGDASFTVWTRRSLRAPFRQLCRLTAHRTAHFEYMTRSPDGFISRRHVTVPG